MQRLNHFIEGRFINGEGAHSIRDLNPSDVSDVIAEAPDATTDEVDAAVSAALRSSAAWRSLPAMARAEFLYRWADALANSQEEIARAICREVGKRISEARREFFIDKLPALGTRVDLISAPIQYINLENPRAPAVQMRAHK